MFERRLEEARAAFRAVTRNYNTAKVIIVAPEALVPLAIASL